MDLYQYLEEMIDETKIQEFKGDEYELALIRYVLMTASKLFYRSPLFFLNNEQIKQRHAIYSQKINPHNITNFDIVCSSYCTLLKEVIENKYGTKIELIPTDRDVFKHIALLLTTKAGNRYLIDPLMDLSEMKTGMKTHNFASQERNKNPYMRVKIENLSFLHSEVLEKIDEKIGYTNNHLYTDDILSPFLDNNTTLDFKIMTFFKEIRKEILVDGLVDSILFVKSAFKILLNKEENSKIKVSDFFVDDCDLKDNAIRKIVNCSESRKRGLVLTYANTYIVFSPFHIKFLKLTQEAWEEKRKNNRIFVRKSEFIHLYSYLNDLELEPNILDHREFLKVFSRIEKRILRDGKNPKDYIHVIDRKKIVIHYNVPLVFSIENNLLVLFNQQNHKKFAIHYEDEGKCIKYHSIS